MSDQARLRCHSAILQLASVAGAAGAASAFSIATVAGPLYGRD
jgi:hypothetical protein